MTFRLSGLMAFLFLVAACTTPVKTDVTRFHALNTPQGETFIVVSKTEAMEGSLELMSYAQLVSQHLRAEGFAPAGTAQPDLIIKIGFEISQPVEQRRRGGPYYGGFYGYGGYPYYSYGYPYGYGYHHAGFGHGFGHGFGRGYGYGYGYSSYGYSYVVYERTFEMTIERSNGQVLYEGRATSIGRNKVLPEVMPFLVQAMFTEFPGQSGTTTSVSIKPEKGSGY